MENKALPFPDVKTAITVKDKNFTLEVIAYRMLTEEEGRKCLTFG